MAKVIVDIDNTYIPLLEKEHGDVALWLKSLAESHFVNKNRVIMSEAVKQLMNEKDFTAAVAKLALEHPKFKVMARR